MKFERSTILLTGEVNEKVVVLTKRFIGLGARVIFCGAAREKLEKARRELPELCTIECDLSLESGRFSLFSRVTKKFPAFNILINNLESANESLAVKKQEWEPHRKHLAINLDAPIHLSMLFLPHLLKQEESSIINLMPTGSLENDEYPTISAAREGLKAFFRSLRQQLRDGPISVIDVLIEDEKNSEIADSVMSSLTQGSRCE